MKINIIVKTDKNDSYAPKFPKNEYSIFLESILSDNKCKHIAHNIRSIVQGFKQSPEPTVVDFANLSLAVYAIDQLASRTENGYQDWSRFFKVHLPVVDLKLWNNAATQIESMLSFLTGDKWELEFRAKVHDGKKSSQKEDGTITQVSLFSGGLDSLIGAVDLIDQQNAISLVSHHKIGTGESNAQTTLMEALKKEYPTKTIEGNFFYVQPIKEGNKLGGEDTQRARSIMFIALGLLVANSQGKYTVLEIPENALISLNVPLTATRYGSYSTKTTHPNFLGMLGSILTDISITN
jgi:hypothetical protein